MFGIKTKLIKIKYRINNRHNYTKIKKCVDISKIDVGKGTYGVIDILLYGGENSKLYVGNYCSIANECVFILGGEHKYNTLSTYPFKARILNESESVTKGDIIVSDDVWIGYGSTILSGVKIGQGAIVGAKSIVTKDIPPYAIYVGNKVIKYRFSEEIIDKLLKIDFCKIDKEDIIKNINLFYLEINEDNIDNLIESIKKN